MKELFLLRGLPGSGKSTFAKALTGVYTIEADKYFMDGDEYKFDPSKLKDAHAWCQNTTWVWMTNGVKRITIANTFTQEWEMQPYYDLAEKYGYRVYSLIVENRHGGVNEHGVPEYKLAQMKDRFEVQLIPAKEIHFEDIFGDKKKETLGKEFYESADKVITINRPETFEDYLQRLKDRRTEDNYKYTDEDFKNHIYYIFDCYEKDLSVYKCLEFMYFAERETLLQIDQNNPVTRGSTAIVKREIQPEQIWNDEKKEGIKKLIQEYKDGK